jgi:hypothetical protein
MYDATTRYTYAQLFKQTEATLMQKIASDLVPVLKAHPHIAAAVGSGK